MRELPIPLKELTTSLIITLLETWCRLWFLEHESVKTKAHAAMIDVEGFF